MFALRSRLCGFPIGGVELLLDDREQQIALLDAVAFRAFQEPFGTGKPPGRASRLSFEHKTQTQPERAAGSVDTFAGVQIRMVGAIKCAQIIIVPADQIRRCRQQFEILNSQGCRAIGEQERMVGIGPGTLPTGLTAPFEFAEGVGNARTPTTGA